MRKTCSKCEITKELTEFNKRKDAKEGYRSYCRECEKEWHKLYRENNREKIAKSKKLYRENNREKIAKRNKLYRENNREKELKRKKLYRENNREKVLEGHKLYRENNREKVLKRNKLYRENNREKELKRKKLYRENNREKVLESHKLYYENNREKCLLQKARQRARKKSLPFSLTEEDIVIPDTCPVLGIQLFSGEGVMCDNSPNLDRIIPEKGYVPGNVRVISQRANRIKSNATAEEIRLVWEDLLKIEKDEN